jgi:hypothetical protein
MKNLRQLVRWSSTLLASLPGACQPVSPALPLQYSQAPVDLTSTQVSYPAPTIPATCNMPSCFPPLQGANPQRDHQNLLARSRASSVLIVCLGRAAAGAAWPPLWRLFRSAPSQKTSRLKDFWESQSLSNTPEMGLHDMVARNDVNDFEQAVRPYGSPK